MHKINQLRRFLSSLSLATAIGIVLLASPLSFAQEGGSGKGTTSYIGAGGFKTTSSSAWNLGYPVPPQPEIESTDAGLVWLTAPGLGKQGFSFGYNVIVSTGVEDSADNAGYFELGNNTVADNTDLSIEAEYTYEETARITATYAAYYSFAERFHPYFEAGAYYALGSEATMKGTASGLCGAALDETETGTTFGFVYGAGMLVNLSKDIAMLASYNIYDNVDFDFELGCGDDIYTLASFDSKVTSYGLSLLYSF